MYDGVSWFLRTLISDPRLMVGIITMLAMALCASNAMLIGAFNPGREMVVPPRVAIHAAFSLYLLRRFVAIIRSTLTTWSWDWVTTLAVNTLILLAALWLLRSILRQIDSDRARAMERGRHNLVYTTRRASRAARSKETA